MKRASALTLLPLLGGLLLGGCGAPRQSENETDSAPPAAAVEGDFDRSDYPRWETLEPGQFADYNRRTNLMQRGKDVYGKYCVGCHGPGGQGDGPASARLITKPRDFTSGIYKFRSTDSGSLPMEIDLYRTITRGLSGVSMPAFPLMPHRDKLAVIEYIKRLYPEWEAEAARRSVVPIPTAPRDLDDSRRIERGRIVYVAMQCTQCHGTDGRGAGATRTEYTDAWGNPQKPFDFTRGALKGGAAPEDIYRTFHTGLRSIMPSYDSTTLMTVVQEGFPPQEGLLSDGEMQRLAAALLDFPATGDELFESPAADQQRLGERNSWDLVAYIQSLREVETTAAAVLGPSFVGANR